jgi:hypothetical protein
MFRHALVVLTLAGLAGTAPAATWAEGLFDSLSHDFGTVPRGPVVTHYFHLTNTTGQPLHIASVRVSCGCLNASATRRDIPPGESATIVAQLHTDRFNGFWRKPMYVTFDQPQWSEVTIMVQAVSRDDVALAPESLAFGHIPQGTARDASVQVLLSGGNWKILQAKSDSDYVEPKVRLLRQDGGESSYQVTAHLRPDLPAGHWFTSIKIATDNPAIPQLSIPLTVEVTQPASASSKTTGTGQRKTNQPDRRTDSGAARQPVSQSR